MTEEEKIISELLEVMESAIKSGDWKVDGACDPDHAMWRAESYLYNHGWRKDDITGEQFVEAM